MNEIDKLVIFHRLLYDISVTFTYIVLTKSITEVGMEILAILMVQICFIMLGCIIYLFILALVSMLTGVCMGYRITSFSFAGIMIINNNKKISVTMAPWRLIAQAELFRKEMSGRLKFIKETLDFILMTVFTGTALTIWYRLLVENIYLQYIDKILIVIWFIHLFSMLGMIKKAFSKGHDHYIWEQEIKISNQLKNGVRPGQIALTDVDMNSKDFIERRCILYNYYTLLDSKKYDELPLYIERFEHYIGTQFNIASQNVPYAYEIVYYYSIINYNLERAEHYVALLGELLKNDMDLNGRRVYAGYLLGTNKPKESVMRVLEQCKADEHRFNSQVISGMEYELISQLKEKLYNR